ncbi:MAG: exodeoxyribonuclease-3 [Candidatus Binatia bacterium]|jgi:exodeoxyribonuclease-3
MPKNKKPFKLISWNVNGVRASLPKGLMELLTTTDADVVCLQECKVLPEQIPDVEFPKHFQIHWNPAEKKGYSGTAIFTRTEPVKVTRGMNIARHDQEGRVITAEYEDFFVLNVYTPNSQNELRRLDYRTNEWDIDFRKHLVKLAKKKPVIFCGDLNVAHQEIDLKNPKTNKRNAGFTDEERDRFSELLDAGFVDTFREFEKGPDHYSWWSYRAGARARNVGWRLDYCCVSEALRPRLTSAFIQPERTGSDHCPVGLTLS